jgi:alkanesulfonate monooxygenase SsuD/methylene tetrahydromethanopterin reductase-like flavin-dependent oxidoreductase (luciferase family)
VQPDLPMWIGGSSDAAIRRTAKYGTGWQGGGETLEDAIRVVAAIKKALPEAGRTIDPDHYGASFPFYFGAPDATVTRAMDAYAKRTGRDPYKQFAVGDADTILKRVGQYVAGGVEKFILRPVGSGEQVLEQTKQLIDQVLPQVGVRWPKTAKAA